MTFRTDGSRGLSIFVAVLAACLAVGPTSAQEPDGFLFLREVQEIPGAIDPTILSREIPFVVDDTATWVNIHVFATADNLLTSIEGPTAQTLDPATIGGFGGTYAHYGAVEPVGSYALNPLMAPGINYLYSFPSLGAGTYTLTVAGDAGLSETVAFVHPIWGGMGKQRARSTPRADRLSTLKGSSEVMKRSLPMPPHLDSPPDWGCTPVAFVSSCYLDSDVSTGLMTSTFFQGMKTRIDA